MAFWKKNEDVGKKMSQAMPAGWKISDLGLLGQGGMSQVYRVRDEALGREIALKVLRPELSSQDTALEQFIEEAKITAQLDHPNIPPVYALAAERKTTCFTMKVLEGQTLQQFIDAKRTDGTSALFPALEVLVRVCDAVAFAHTRGILHCDLKPHNVMVGSHGQIYVVDWGLARRMKDLPAEGEDDGSHGTPAYMPPEQALGHNHALDQRTDIYCLGGILYRILTGRPPHVGKTAEDTHKLAEKGNVVPPETVAPKGVTVPRRLSAIAMRALQKNPDDRYPTVEEFRRDVEDFIKGTARLPELVFEPGQAIVTEGEPGDCAYVILDGHCQASRQVGGKREMLRLLGPGEMFGEAAVLTGHQRLATVTALMPTTVAVVDRTYFQEEMERTSIIALAIRAVASIFLDLNGQTAALLQEREEHRAVDLALRELALKGQPTANGGRSTSWQPLLARLVQQTGIDAQTITTRVARQPGFEIHHPSDRLILNPPQP